MSVVQVGQLISEGSDVLEPGLKNEETSLLGFCRVFLFSIKPTCQKIYSNNFTKCAICIRAYAALIIRLGVFCHQLLPGEEIVRLSWLSSVVGAGIPLCIASPR